MADLWGKKKPQFQDQQVNLLTGKWGYEDVKACSALEHSRRELLALAEQSWDSLPEVHRAYLRDVLEFEKAWYERTCKDWRMFWKQPESKGNTGGKALDGWWRKTEVSRGSHPTDKGEPSGSSTPADNKKALAKLMKDSGLL